MIKLNGIKAKYEGRNSNNILHTKILEDLLIEMYPDGKNIYIYHYIHHFNVIIINYRNKIC